LKLKNKYKTETEIETEKYFTAIFRLKDSEFSNRELGFLLGDGPQCPLAPKPDNETIFMNASLQ